LNQSQTVVITFVLVASIRSTQPYTYNHLQSNSVDLESSADVSHSDSNKDESDPRSTNRPFFGDSMTNQTVPVGRDASFQCIVKNLHNHKVSVINDFASFTTIDTSNKLNRSKVPSTIVNASVIMMKSQ
jgi:hypothetical protein